MDHRLPRGPLTTASFGLLAAALTVGLAPQLAALPAVANTASPADVAPVSTIGDAVPGLSDLDARGTARPTAAQRAAATSLGASDLRWNQFGTPSSILPAGGSLGRATSRDPVAAARAWLEQHAAVFGRSRSQMSALRLVNDQKLAMSPARAVLFRQAFGGLTPALDSMVTVGVAHGQISFVSSSLTRTTGTPPAATMSPLQGWLKAAANVGRAVPGTDVANITQSVKGGWTRLQVPGLAQQQQVRLRSLALADGSVRPVFEANVTDVAQGSAFAYTLMVDAASGRILHRQNQVDNSSNVYPFNGEITATDCGPKHEFELTDDKTRQIVATAAMANSADDIVVKIFAPNGDLLTSGDTGTSPEAATYTAGSIPSGIYSMQVCPFTSPTVPFTPPGNYAASVATSDQSSGGNNTSFPPRWRYFTANPNLGSLGSASATNSVIGCWTAGPGCTSPTGPFRTVEEPGPWDTNIGTGQPNLTTVGNNASTHEAWASPLTPGGTAQAPVSPTRKYTDPFTDAWNNSKCDPTNLHPGGNDINAVVANLFVSHNRMHDYAYYLGFTESNYNLQQDNMGRGGAQNDPEIGNAEAGAVDGGAPSYEGRDNANQIAEQDGVPGITNQYLFQPIAGAFYSPCADGAMDMTVVGHEYTHAISNRMVGGPDEGLTSAQGGAMGESWSDLDALEYLYSHHYSTGARPTVIGPYATGNNKAGIRDYDLAKNPLNYSDIGFDTTGVEVHADGEVWNGVQWAVRGAMVKKWNKRFPYHNRRLQLHCVDGGATHSPLPPSQCPGNHRWIQLVFDSFLLQQGATSMLDARDAMLAADKMRFGGKDLKVMWRAFARRGMGKGASVKNADDPQPRPSFASPRSKNGVVRFRGPGGGKLYVGKYQARVTPVADLSKKSKRDNKAAFVPGRYSMIYVSPRTGFTRFSLRVRPGQHTTYRVHARRNLAAAKRGAKVIRASAGSLNPRALLDGSEGTNWGGVNGDGTNVDAHHPFVSVDLAGRVHRIHRVQVSAMLNPGPSSPTDVPLAKDPDSGSRFTALRRFAIEVCVHHCAKTSARWHRVYTSRPNAFPAIDPRPVAPNLILRSFKLHRSVRAAAVRLVALENQCTGFRGYAGEQDNDPSNSTDCKTASDRGTIVHAAELEVF
jgi:hypothetical protein